MPSTMATRPERRAPTAGRCNTSVPSSRTDLDVTYNVSKELALTIGANNLFNTYPDRLNNNSGQIYPVTGGDLFGQVYARNGGPIGLNGGFWYAKVKIKY